MAAAEIAGPPAPPPEGSALPPQNPPSSGLKFAGIKDIFEVAVNTREDEKQKQHDSERSLLICGSKGGGKTSLVQRFLDCLGPEAPKPTMALEYTFGRRQHPNNMGKDIVHLWELGGGTFLTQMIDSVVTKDTIGDVSVMLVLDLSKPKELWYTLHGLLDALKQRVGFIVGELIARDSRTPDRLRKRAYQRVGEEHQDKEMVEPLLVPVTILGTKYDLFRDFSPQERKVLCSTLRYIAHMHGASLYFVSDRGDRKDELQHRSKSLMNAMAFRSSANTRGIVADFDKPLMIAVGADSLDSIGNPPIQVEGGKVRTPLDLWQQAYDQIFPASPESKNTEIPPDPCAGDRFLEPEVDEMRAHKDDVLEQYRKKSEQRAADLAKKHASSGKKTPRKPAGPPGSKGGGARRTARK